MTGDFNHTLDLAYSLLTGIGKKAKMNSRYIMAQCPKHDGGDLNCQISLNNKGKLYAYCHSHCGGFFLDTIFSGLKQPFNIQDEYNINFNKKNDYTASQPPITANLNRSDTMNLQQMINLWEQADTLIGKEKVFKRIPNYYLDAHEWRYVKDFKGNGPSVFIPYWDDIPGESRINYMQIRHLDKEKSSRRFSFPYGSEQRFIFNKYAMNMAKEMEQPVLIVEGSHDAIVLDYIDYYVIALPSSGSRKALENLIKYAKDTGIEFIYAGDNDDAGNKLLKNFSDISNKYNYSYRMITPPNGYKDWAEVYELNGEDYVKSLIHPMYGLNYDTIPPLDRGIMESMNEIFGDVDIVSLPENPF